MYFQEELLKLFTGICCYVKVAALIYIFKFLDVEYFFSPSKKHSDRGLYSVLTFLALIPGNVLAVSKMPNSVVWAGGVSKKRGWIKKLRSKMRIVASNVSSRQFWLNSKFMLYIKEINKKHIYLFNL